MNDEFVPILSAGILHSVPVRVIIVRDIRNRAVIQTHCGQTVTHPGPDWRGAKRICGRCLPGETLADLLAINS